MTTYLVAIHLVVEAGAADPRAEIAGQLDAILSDRKVQSRGVPPALLDWAVAGDDLAESIAAVALSGDYQPGKSDFPAWPQAKPRSARG